MRSRRADIFLWGLSKLVSSPQQHMPNSMNPRTISIKQFAGTAVFGLLWLLWAPQIGWAEQQKISLPQNSAGSQHALGAKKASSDARPVVSPQPCPEQWRRWLERYAGASVFTSLNKSTPYPYTQKQINAAIEQRERVSLEVPIPVNGKEISTLNIHEERRTHERVREALRKEYAQMHKRSGVYHVDRDEVMAAFMHHLVRNNPPDNLLIFEVGLEHAIDFNLLMPRSDVAYVGQQINGKTAIGSQGLYRLHDLLRGHSKTWDYFLAGAKDQYDSFWEGGPRAR